MGCVGAQGDADGEGGAVGAAVVVVVAGADGLGALVVAVGGLVVEGAAWRRADVVAVRPAVVTVVPSTTGTGANVVVVSSSKPVKAEVVEVVARLAVVGVRSVAATWEPSSLVRATGTAAANRMKLMAAVATKALRSRRRR